MKKGSGSAGYTYLVTALLSIAFLSMLNTNAIGQVGIVVDDASQSEHDRTNTTHSTPLEPSAASELEEYQIVRLTFDAAASDHPKAVVDSQYLYLVWEDKRDGGPDFEVYWQRFDRNGVPQTLPIRVSNTSSHSVAPGVAVDDLGNSYIVWQEDTPWGTIYAAKVDVNGSLLVAPFAVSSNLSMDPEISALPSGSNAIVYHRRAPTDQDVYMRHGNSNLEQVCVQRLNAGTLPSFEKEPAVTLLANGTAFVAWYDLAQNFQDGVYVAGVAYPSCGLTDYRRHADGDYESCAAGFSGSFPWLACQGSGNVYNLYGDHGIARVNDVVGTASLPRVANDPSFGYIVWQDSRHGDSEIYLSKAYGSNAYVDERLTNNPSSSTNPDIASRSAEPGKWWVVFQDNRDGNPEIYLTGPTVDNDCVSGVDADMDGVDDDCDNCINFHPVLQNSGPFQIALSTFWSYEPQISDADDATHTVQYLSIPSWLNLSGDSLYGASSDSLIESYSITFVVADACNRDTFTVNLSIRDCGDIDGDGQVIISDIVCLLNWIFNLGCTSFNQGTIGDVNCDGKTNIGDCVYLVNYLFAGGPAPCAACP